jgi:hypothetical protein
MTLKNWTINGKGFRKWFWYLFFEIITMRGYFPVKVDGCRFEYFHMHKDELKHWQLCRFIQENIKK